MIKTQAKVSRHANGSLILVLAGAACKKLLEGFCISYWCTQSKYPVLQYMVPDSAFWGRLGNQRSNENFFNFAKVPYFESGFFHNFMGEDQGPLVTDGRNRRNLISWAWTLCRLPLTFQK